MKLVVTDKIKKKLNGRWVKFNEEVSFKINLPDRLKVFTIDSTLGYIGRYVAISIEDWKGIEGENDKPLPCTQDNIETVLKAYQEVYDFLNRELRKLFDELDAELKN